MVGGGEGAQRNDPHSVCAQLCISTNVIVLYCMGKASYFAII